MTERVHTLKTWPGQFAHLADGSKTFEFRRNDRDFGVGNILLCVEWDPAPRGVGVLGFGPALRPQWQAFRVTHILLSGFGVPDGYVCMSIARLTLYEAVEASQQSEGITLTDTQLVHPELRERGSR